jgi:outer membrane immunogenic protein
MLGSSNWIGRIEYLHYDFGQVEFSSTFTSTVPRQSGADNGGRQTINVARAGVSYKFTP